MVVSEKISPGNECAIVFVLSYLEFVSFRFTSRHLCNRIAGDVVVPVLAVDQIGTQSVSAVMGWVSGSAVTMAIAAGQDDL